MAYIKITLTSNCAFSMKGQHLLARRSTMPQNLRNCNGSPQAKNSSPTYLSIALELDDYFSKFFLHMC